MRCQKVSGEGTLNTLKLYYEKQCLPFSHSMTNLPETVRVLKIPKLVHTLHVEDIKPSQI